VRPPPLAPLPLAAAVVLASCSLFSPEVTGIVSTPAPSLRTLAEKARLYEEDLRDHHLSPQGLLLSPVQRASKKEAKPLANKADQAAWTGCLLAAYAFRHAAEDGDLADVRRTLGALRLLQDVTGVPGLLARGVAPGPSDDPRYEKGAPPHADLVWRKDSSRDQYTFVLFGYAATLACVEEASIREVVARDAGALADHVLSEGFSIRGPDGRTTTYGDLRPRWAGLVPNGVNAGVLLLAASLAAHASGGEEAAARYRDLVEDGLPGIVPKGIFRILGLHNPNNDNMSFACLDGLRRIEDDPSLRATYARGIARGWRLARGSGNALFASIAFAATGDPEAREEATESLRLFPEEKVGYAIDNRDLPGLGRRLLPDTSMSPRSRLAVPIHRQPMTSFVWKNDPFRLVSNPGARGEEEYAGVDYLLAYWMLRAQDGIGPGD